MTINPLGCPPWSTEHESSQTRTHDSYTTPWDTILQTAKRLSAGSTPTTPAIPDELVKAVHRIDASKDAAEYLSNTADNKFLSVVWREFWFDWIATKDVLTPWKMNGTAYEEPSTFTRIQKDDKSGLSQIWEGRSGSLKASLVEMLNAGKIKESTAWELFAQGFSTPTGQNKQGIRERAHSYREDMDSSLAQLGWIGPDGTPTDEGYRFIAICERFGGANSDAAIEYFGATLLQAGHYASFLHYIYRLSEEKFSTDPLAFTKNISGKPVFREASYTDYLNYLEDKLSNDLKVMRKVSGRGRPRHRTPFQAELTLLRNYGFVSKKRYRLGVGIPIDWERVLNALQVEL